jgi:processive 1,2-diacylglycerol beta-glucosyltransferase
MDSPALSPRAPRTGESYPFGREAIRVLILYSDIGEGHAASARGIAAQIAQKDPRVLTQLCNGFDALDPMLRWLMRDLYQSQLFDHPWLYSGAYGVFKKLAQARSVGAAAMRISGARSCMRIISGYSPDLIVSTDPRVNVMLGHLRKKGRIECPVCGVLTDFGGLEFWADRGLDRHFVMDERLVSRVDTLIGKGRASAVLPPVDPRFFDPLSRSKARARLALGDDTPVILVSGGGWGVGDFEGALAVGLEVENSHVICLAGRNEELHGRLTALVSDRGLDAGRLQVLGFINHMDTLLAAADVIVHSTAGVTCLEAMARHCPIILYGAPPGHALAAATRMHDLGVATHAESSEELQRALALVFASSGARSEAAPSTVPMPSVADAILSLRPARIDAPRVASRPATPRRTTPTQGDRNGSAQTGAKRKIATRVGLSLAVLVTAAVFLLSGHGFAPVLSRGLHPAQPAVSWSAQPVAYHHIPIR